MPEQTKQQQSNESPAVHQQQNVRQNEALNINANPRANENLSDKPDAVKKQGDGVGSEITDGEGG